MRSRASVHVRGTVKHRFQIPIDVGSTDQESSQQLRTWFSKHFFAPKLVA